MFSLASTLLSKIASPAFEEAYVRIRSIREAKDELKKLAETIETIKDVLLDAEEQQGSKGAVKNWIKRVRDVLYDVDDLFDEVATDDMLKQQIIKQEGKSLGKVHTFFSSELNPIISRYSIAKKVKAIRKRLVEISTDTILVNFVIRRCEEPIGSANCAMKRDDPGYFVDLKGVIGRDDERKTILEMILNDQPNDDVSVIAVVGIGGMGKTTFAQLVYNDEKVRDNLKKNRWFACISDTSDNEEVIRKIFQSICEKNYADLNVGQLQKKMRDAINEKKFLLVLDDVWDDDRASWINRMSLLSGCAKGSKIIVTTRSLSVASAMGVGEAHTLKLDGLSKDESWALFRRVALTSKQEVDDPRWTELGREIVKKCTNVPLAIMSIGSLLCKKATIQEWESFKNLELTKLGERAQDPIMAVLKLSYDHLNSSVKQCFAYCSLFPKDYIFKKRDLIYLWIAQGYIKPNSNMQTVEDVGHSYFMDLFRMCFFQEAEYDRWGEIEKCKMHDLIHDLAQKVSAEESIVFPTSAEIKGKLRHTSFYSITSDSSANLTLLLKGNRLRSLFFIDVEQIRGLFLDQQVPNLKFLRTLRLPFSLRMDDVPSSIGELKLLRYLDLSRNTFKKLPNSITKLLNLCTLDLSRCKELEALPIDLGKLVNLRHLKIRHCDSLSYAPSGFGVLASLQHLDEFRTQINKLRELFGLKIRGDVYVRFGGESDDVDWNGVECWQPLVNLQGLSIKSYNGKRIPHWVNRRAADVPFLLLPNLTRLCLSYCVRVKCLPPFRHLPNLNFLILRSLYELEYVEEEEGNGGKQNLKAGTDELFLPHLKSLQFSWLPKLKGWSKRVEAALTSKDEVAAKGEEHSSSTSASACALLPSFPSLATIDMRGCEKLKYMPLCPRLRVLLLSSVNVKVIPQLLSIADHYSPSTSTSPSSSLEQVEISYVHKLVTFPGQSLASLRQLKISYTPCERLELPPSDLNKVEHLDIRNCLKLEKSCWEEDSRSVDWISLRNLRKLWANNIPRSVDWDSLRNLRKLWADNIPSSERLPECLRNLQSQRKLQINHD